MDRKEKKVYMKRNNQFFKNYYTSSQDNLLKVFAFPSAVLTLIYVSFWFLLDNDIPLSQQILLWMLVVSYGLLYILLKLSNFVRTYIRCFYYINYYVTCITMIYITYLSDFRGEYSLTLMMIIFYLSMTFEKMRPLLLFLISNFVLILLMILIDLLFHNHTNRNALLLLNCLIVISALSILNRYIRNKDVQALRQLALYDPATGLVNRNFLEHNLNQLLDYSGSKEQSVAILFFDLDKFKKINDSMGHSFGDAVLRKASQVIKQCLKEDEILVRYGGDEFIAVLKDSGHQEATETAKKITDAFSSQIYVKGRSIDLTVSIGICIFPIDARDSDTLIKLADIAMYYSKIQGSNNYLIFKKAMIHGILRRQQLEDGLKEAVQKKELLLYYQPQIEFKTNKIIGAEALVRWIHPEYGMLSPSEFIPISEETGLIIPIGEWILKTACMQCKAWLEEGLPVILISVNVSYYQLKHPGFIQTVTDALAESGLEARYLELEITESIIRKAEELRFILYELIPLGVHISIDDFGVGYSSLSMLQYLVINNLKIDMSFIKDILKNPKSDAIVKAVIEMGIHLNCTITAEGVETEEQADFLRTNNCTIGQGYLFGKPMEAAEFEKLLKL